MRGHLDDVLLSPDELHRLRVTSSRTGVPIAEIIRAAVRLALDKPALVLPREAVGLRRVPRPPAAPDSADDGEE